MTQNNISHRRSVMIKEMLEWREYHRSFRNHVIKHHYAESVFIWTLSIVEVPLMLLTLIALCFLIKSRHAASVYVIHLILSDLVQVICMILSTIKRTPMLWDAYDYSLIAGVYFMACIAFERYLLVSHPYWYRTHHSLKSSCFISFIIWFVPLIFAEIKPSDLYFDHLYESIAFFFPYPMIILCFIGTWRGLSHAISLTSHKRKLILGSLLLVLLNYTFLFLSHSILYFLKEFRYKIPSAVKNLTFDRVALFLDCLLYLNPLADCILYLFMRTDAGDVMKSLHCCCKSDSQQISVRYTTRANTGNDDVQ